MDCNKCNDPIMAKDQHIALLNRRYLKAIIAIVLAALILMSAEAAIFVWLWNQYDYVENVSENGNITSNGSTIQPKKEALRKGRFILFLTNS